MKNLQDLIDTVKNGENRIKLLTATTLHSDTSIRFDRGYRSLELTDDQRTRVQNLLKEFLQETVEKEQPNQIKLETLNNLIGQ